MGKLTTEVRLTKGMRAWLERIAVRGTWPDRPFLRDSESAVPLMQMGLVEAIKPPPPYLSFVAITPAGRAALTPNGEERK